MGSETRKISIAVPSLNYGRFVTACLESIRRQDHEEFEVLIADGGSRDGSVEIIERYCELDPRFRLVSRSDTGQVDAIVRAFSHATGDVYCFLNADDCYLCDDAFSSAVHAFRAYPGVDVVTFGGYYLDVEGRHTRPVRLRYHPLDDIGMMKHRSGALQPATFWTRKVHDAIPLRADFEYSFDTVFFYEAWTRFSWLELSKPLAGYRIHTDNKSIQINSSRVFEVARFETMKFGRYSLRAAYLRMIGAAVAVFGSVPGIGSVLLRLLRIAVNALAAGTAYRFPSI